MGRSEALGSARGGGPALVGAGALTLLLLVHTASALASDVLTWAPAADGRAMVDWSRPGPVVVTAEGVQPTAYDVPRINDEWTPEAGDDWWDGGLPVGFLANDEHRQPDPSDLSAEVRLGWNERGLALLVRVVDDVAVEQADIEDLWEGDSLELFVSDGVGSENRYQVVIAPGRDPDHPEPRHRFYEVPGGLSTEGLTIEKAARPTLRDDGYVVKALLPWSNLANAGQFSPRPGATFAFQIYVNDHDDPEDAGNWQWVGLHPGRSAADDARVMRSFRLAEQRGHGIHARARVEIGDEDERRVELWGPRDLVGQTVRITDAQRSLGDATFEADGRRARATLSLPPAPEAHADQPMRATFTLSGPVVSMDNGRIQIEKPDGGITSLAIVDMVDEQVRLRSATGEWAALAFADLNDAERDDVRLATMTHLVELPGARAMAVHEELGLLVIGYQDDEQAGSLAVFELDERGRVASGPPARLALPRPEALAEQASYPLAMGFHGSLPVLYVWQDIADGDADAIHEHFDHLVIFTIDDGELIKAGAFGRGAEYAHGQSEASLAVAGDGTRLFIPNLRGGSGSGAVGYFDLDDQGMPVPVPVPIEGSLDGRGVNEFDMQYTPHWVDTGRNRDTSRHYRYINTQPTGSGFFAPNQRVLVFGARSGLGVWDTEDRRGELSEVAVAGIGSSISGTYVGGHPELPLIYALRQGGNEMLSMAHARGFPTLLPDTATASGAEFRSPPVVFNGASHGLAVGGPGRFYLLGLDDAGQFNGLLHRFDAPGSGHVRALAYSSRHDRLYVAVNENP